MTHPAEITKFSQEFPDFPAADFPSLPPGFTDSSFRNDACPSMKNETLGLFVFVDYADRAKREAIDGGNARFAVLKLDGEGFLDNSPMILTTDVWQDVLDLIDSKHAPQPLGATENVGSTLAAPKTTLGDILDTACTYPNCKCIVSTSTTMPEPVCPKGMGR